jgi:hypothetical protein
MKIKQLNFVNVHLHIDEVPFDRCYSETKVVVVVVAVAVVAVVVVVVVDETPSFLSHLSVMLIF